MTGHETPQQRYRRQKRDKLRNSQIAVSYTVAPVRCECGQARLMHRDDGVSTACLAYGCGCTEYREVT